MGNRPERLIRNLDEDEEEEEKGGGGDVSGERLKSYSQ
jgi:hypothetical protein